MDTRRPQLEARAEWMRLMGVTEEEIAYWCQPGADTMTTHDEDHANIESARSLSRIPVQKK